MISGSREKSLDRLIRQGKVRPASALAGQADAELDGGWRKALGWPEGGAFLRETLQEGWRLYRSGSVTRRTFFRELYYCRVEEATGSVHVVHEAVALPKNARLSSLFHCQCSQARSNVLCSHAAALLFAVRERLLHTAKAQAAYDCSLLYHLVLSNCRERHRGHPLQWEGSPAGGSVRDRHGEPVLELRDLAVQIEPFFAEAWSPLKASKGGRFHQLARMGISKEQAAALKLTPFAASVQSEFGLLGDLMRQVFLTSPTWRGTVEPVEGGKRMRLELHAGEGRRGAASPDESVPAEETEEALPTIITHLEPAAAHVLLKRFAKELKLDVAPEADEIWDKGYELKVLDDGALEVTTVAISPDRSRRLPMQGIEDKDFGDSRLIPGVGYRKVRTSEGALYRKYLGWKKYRVNHEDVLAFLQKFGSELRESDFCFCDSMLIEGSQAAQFEKIHITVIEKESGSYWISLGYRLNGRMLLLKELHAAFRSKRKLLLTPMGWVDFDAPELGWMRSLSPESFRERKKRIQARLSRVQLLRLCACFDDNGIDLDDGGYKELGILTKRDFEGSSPASSVATAHQPAADAADEPQTMPPGETDAAPELRPYQREGLEWLKHLVHHQVSGILADDMGLGKTHQVMALMENLFRQSGGVGRFLVICPTSVLYHWQDKLARFHPALASGLYHSGQRDLKAWKEAKCPVLITTYGVVRNDRELLAQVEWDLVVLDEAQLAKNRETETWKALASLPAGSRLALSGTPLENTPWDLKSLFDLLLPGYFPSESEFRRFIAEPLESRSDDEGARAFLKALIRPFFLRRTKEEVLDDLPDKVEETYRCVMEEEQRRFYTDALLARGREVLDELGDDRRPPPVMHLFQLLGLLKQICNHPGSLKIGAAPSIPSAKFGLFCELLQSALDAGLKIVVFSQYLRMLELIREHLGSIGIDHAVLTGATRDRAGELRRFRDDPDCRVFCCSLKAGGVGIDLTAASVVFHYDRWWNAARENQATDRVHRIGQSRNVQVFKLLTADTIEERIDELIRRKASLMEAITEGGEEGAFRLLSREEMQNLLRHGPLST